MLSFAACSSMQVTTTQAPGANLAKYRTFAWAHQPERASSQSSILDQYVKADVEQQLSSKGLLPAGDAQPDLLISYTGKSTTSYEYGGGPGYWGAPGAWDWGTVYPVKEGQLSLQFIDPKTKKVVWQGIASDVIDNSGGKPEQIADAVKAILKKYPANPVA